MTTTDPPENPRQATKQDPARPSGPDAPSDDNAPGDRTPPQPGIVPPPPARKLYRDPAGPVRGVATGIANYFAIDPVLVQLGFVALTLFGGSGILVYVAGWLLIPESDQYGPTTSRSQPGAPAIIIGALALLLALGALLSTAGLGFAFNGPFFFWLLLLGAGLFLLNQRPDEVAAVGTSIKDLVRPAPQAAAQHPTQPWASPRTDLGPPVKASAVAPATTTAPSAQPAPPTQGAATPVGSVGDFNQRLSAVGTSTSNLATSFQRPPQAPAPAKDPGPPITSMTLALAAIAVGVLAALDQLTDLSIDATVLFGSVLAISGLGLMVAAVKGRAWGLLPVALIAAIGAITSPLADLTISGGVGDRTYTVQSPAELDEIYKLAAGELRLDLSQLDITVDTTVEVKMGAGTVTIIVPADTNVDVTADAKFGGVTVFSRVQEGVDVSLHKVETPTGSAAPILTINAETTFGEVEIRHDN